MIPSGMPRKTKTAQAARRARPFAGFLSRAYRSHARAGMWRLLMVPIRNVETRMEWNKAHGENIKDNNWTRIGIRVSPQAAAALVILKRGTESFQSHSLSDRGETRCATQRASFSDFVRSPPPRPPARGSWRSDPR